MEINKTNVYAFWKFKWWHISKVLDTCKHKTHTRTDIHTHIDNKLLFHSSLRQPIKSFRWRARPRLYLTNEVWLSGWQTPSDDQLDWCQHNHCLSSISNHHHFMRWTVPQTRRLIIIRTEQSPVKVWPCKLDCQPSSAWCRMFHFPLLIK